jgi:hypothetical protein
VRSELYGTAKAIAAEKPFGFHIMQNLTFSPFYRAEEDYSKTKDFADYLKLATYNNAGGPRMKAYMEGLGATMFHDAKPKDFELLLQADEPSGRAVRNPEHQRSHSGLPGARALPQVPR